MVYDCTQERVSIDGEYSGKIFDTDLSVVPGDLYTMALTRPRVTCRRYTFKGVVLRCVARREMGLRNLTYFTTSRQHIQKLQRHPKLCSDFLLNFTMI
jgi:hypothetical protein